MPGPVYVPGAKLPSFKAQPKPQAKPWITLPALPDSPTPQIPTAITATWAPLWHAIGSTTPYYVNSSRASRRALRAFGKTHG